MRTCLRRISIVLAMTIAPRGIVFSLLFGRPSGLMSPSRTTFSGCKRSTKLRNLARLICPIGRRTTRTLAGETGDSWSSILRTLMRREVLTLLSCLEVVSIDILGGSWYFRLWQKRSKKSTTLPEESVVDVLFHHGH